MYKIISDAITEKFVKLEIIKENDREVYKYGLELLISLIMTTGIIITASLFLGKFISTLLYLAGFFNARTICGGYHAKHHYSCFMLTISSYIVFLLLNFAFYSKPYLNWVTVFMTVFSAIMITAFAPIEHPDNPMTEYRKNRNRRLSIILSIIICLVCFISLLFKTVSPYVYCYASGIFLAALSIPAAKIEMINIKRKEAE